MTYRRRARTLWATSEAVKPDAARSGSLIRPGGVNCETGWLACGGLALSAGKCTRFDARVILAGGAADFVFAFPAGGEGATPETVS